MRALAHLRGALRSLAAVGLVLLMSLSASSFAGSAAASPTAARGRPPLLAYYYIWFNHSSWRRAKIDYPLVGRYSSSDVSVMRTQVREAKAAGIDGFIVSWKDTPTDDYRLAKLMEVAAELHFKLAVIYEALDFYRHPLPVTTVAAGLRMLADRYATSSVFYRLGDKPLVIWEGTWDYSLGEISQVVSPLRGRLLVLATEKSVAGCRRVLPLVGGDAYYWSSVNPYTDGGYARKLDAMSAELHRAGKYWLAPLAPGFDARLVGGHRVVPRDNGATLRKEYATAAASAPDVLGLISWNEFSENTYVEPSVRFHYRYLDVLAGLRGLPSLEGEKAIRPSSSSPFGIPYWPNLLRIAGSVLLLVLVGAAGVLYQTRRQPGRHRRRDRCIPGTS